MDDFDKTLTPAERSAPTFLEWSDATLARAVRELAIRIHDGVGGNAIIGQAAAIALEKVLRDAGATHMKITLHGGTTITVKTRASS